MEDWENKPMLTQVMPVMTRQRYTKFLCYHLQLAGINCFPIDYPVIPRGMNRLRIVFHATNTEAEAERLANGICEWAQEMLDIEAAGKGGSKIPSAARQVFAAQAAAETEKALSAMSLKPKSVATGIEKQVSESTVTEITDPFPMSTPISVH